MAVASKPVVSSIVEKVLQNRYYLVAAVIQRGVYNPSLKNTGIQAWSGTIGAYRICSFIAWKGFYFKT